MLLVHTSRLFHRAMLSLVYSGQPHQIPPPNGDLENLFPCDLECDPSLRWPLVEIFRRPIRWVQLQILVHSLPYLSPSRTRGYKEHDCIRFRRFCFFVNLPCWPVATLLWSLPTLAKITVSSSKRLRRSQTACLRMIRFAECLLNLIPASLSDFSSIGFVCSHIGCILCKGVDPPRLHKIGVYNRARGIAR